LIINGSSADYKANTFCRQADQPSFIPGRFILEGVITLHEILHELRISKSEGIILKLDFEKDYDKVRWSFLIEVLKQKNSPGTWIEWIRQCVEGGKVGVKINGTQGNFFNTHKGLRQGDPLSPLLFNLVSDALGAMLDRARRNGQVCGLVPHLIILRGDYTLTVRRRHYHFSTKFLLYCFEEMSGLRVNYQKSDAIVVGGYEDEQNRVAGMFKCSTGTLPMKYLGVMVSDRHMSSTAYEIHSWKWQESTLLA
jgi:hypothetical protein